MARFTVRLYSDFGMVPQDKTRILFESDDLREIKAEILDYFKREHYFNAVYFVDNKLNKSGYVGRDLKINCDEDLNSFCEEEAIEEVIQDKNFDALTTMYGIALNGVLSQEENRLEECDTILTKSLKALEIIKEKNVDIGLLKITKTVETYNKEIKKILFGYDDGELIQEEYDLLKEVLKDE